MVECREEQKLRLLFTRQSFDSRNPVEESSPLSPCRNFKSCLAWTWPCSGLSFACCAAVWPAERADVKECETFHPVGMFEAKHIAKCYSDDRKTIVLDKRRNVCEKRENPLNKSPMVASGEMFTPIHVERLVRTRIIIAGSMQSCEVSEIIWVLTSKSLLCRA